METLATLTEKQVTALRADPTALSTPALRPGGKVYRIEEGKAALFYDTKAQYVWSLAFSGPALYVGTGLPGEIHRVDGGDGRGQRVHAAPDPHVRTFHAAETGSVWAGTSGSGLVLKLDAAGNVTTMFDSAKARSHLDRVRAERPRLGGRQLLGRARRQASRSRLRRGSR